MAGADALLVRLTDDGFRNRLDDPRGRVAALAAPLLRLFVNLDELREVNAGPEAVLDGRDVGREAVRSKLESPAGGLIQLFREPLRVARRAPP